MLKRFAFLTLASAVIAIPALAKEDPSVMVQAMKGATTCTLSAGKDAVDTAKFDSDPSWLKSSDGGYAATDLPVMISFPKDDDGIARICVVEATLGSQEEQKDMQLALEVLLKQKPIEQDDSVIWMFGAPPNVRGLQFFPDTTSDKPEIRFIGAAF